MNPPKYCNCIRCTCIYCSYYEEWMECKIESEVKKGKLSFGELKSGISSMSTNNHLMEKMAEDENGYVYPVKNGYKLHWKNKDLKPDIDIIFTYFHEACFYLRSVS